MDQEVTDKHVVVKTPPRPLNGPGDQYGCLAFRSPITTSLLPVVISCFKSLVNNGLLGGWYADIRTTLPLPGRLRETPTA